jgi:hypothetical protein
MPKIDRPERQYGFRPGISAEQLECKLLTYAVTDGTAIKIGKSSGHPSERLHVLQTANSRELRLLAYTNGGGANSEEMVHRRLQRYRLRGEWFELCLEVLGALCNWDWLDVDLHRELSFECINSLR